MVQAPWWDGYCQVMIVARDGVQTGIAQYARSNRVPMAASRSRLGVEIRSFTLPSAVKCCWSVVMSRMFGFTRRRVQPGRQPLAIPQDFFSRRIVLGRRGANVRSA